jgi:dTDP-4-amino-4,6-dideoxygalactose transaminase
VPVDAEPSGRPSGDRVLRFQAPALPDQRLIDGYFEESRAAGWYTNFGPCVRAFEQRISSELLGGTAVVSASNATVALMVAMRAVFGEVTSAASGVLVPSFTFIGSLSAVTWAGFRPIFVDIDADDWQVSEQSLANALADSTVRIAGALLTTTFGTPLTDVRRASVEAVLADRGIPVVVDSAAGLGSCRPSEFPGSATVYSLHATKPFAVGEGAVVASPDPAVADRVRRLTNFGFDAEHELASAIGINAKLPEILAATGLAVLDEFNATSNRRRRHAIDLVERLGGLGLAAQGGNALSSFQFVPLACADHDSRTRLLEASGPAGIQLRTYFDPPMHRVPAFSSDLRAVDLSVTEHLSARMIALPMSNELSADDADAIVELCRSVLG